MYPGLAGAFDLLKKNKDDDETKEDPIAKAEREFFEIIKKVKTSPDFDYVKPCLDLAQL